MEVVLTNPVEGDIDVGASLNELASYFRPLAEQLLIECGRSGVPVRIVDTGRSLTEQRQKIAQKVSWTNNSKHLPQPPEGLSEAIDIVPLAVLSEHKPDWDPTNPAWQIVGHIGRRLGLRWGGDWRETPDPSHFEYVHVAAPQVLVKT